MGTKDTITKDYMADNRVFADVFNGGYNGCIRKSSGTVDGIGRD